jgi:hypothetical protein
MPFRFEAGPLPEFDTSTRRFTRGDAGESAPSTTSRSRDVLTASHSGGWSAAWLTE